MLLRISRFDDLDERKLMDWLASMIFIEDGQSQETGFSLLNDLNEMVKMTKENFAAFGSNQYITKEFLNELDLLTINLKIIEEGNTLEQHNSASIPLFAFSNVIKSITKLFPEYESIFYEKWVKSEVTKFLEEIG